MAKYRNANTGDIFDTAGQPADTVLDVSFRGNWVLIEPDPEPDPAPAVAAFDPSEHTVEEVQAYLASLDGDDDEVQRVLAAEKARKNRKTVVEAVEGSPATSTS